jgi:hypothetical protein
MPNITIITKHSSNSGSIPPAGALQEGELAVNTHPLDLGLYVKDSGGNVALVRTAGSGGISGGTPATASYAITASYALNGGGSGVSSSYTVTASYATVAENVLGTISTASLALGIAPGSTLSNVVISQSLTVSGAVTPYRKNLGSVSGPQTLNLQEANVFGLTLTGDVTFSYTNPKTGSSYVIDAKQNGTGGYRIQFPANSIYPLGFQTSGTLAANESDVYAIYFDGLSYFTTNFVVVPVVTASYALTASYVANATQSVTQSSVSSSYALTASYATIAQNVLGSVTTASYAGTASQADTAFISVSSSYALTASYAANSGPAISSSYALTASYAANASPPVSTSYAITSSYASLAQNVLGSITSASYGLTASYATVAQNVLGSITSASYAATASFANSYVLQTGSTIAIPTDSLLGWWSTDVGTTLTNGRITEWTDRSGQGNTAIQSTVANAPVYLTASVYASGTYQNGLPVARFYAASSSFMRATLSGTLGGLTGLSASFFVAYRRHTNLFGGIIAFYNNGTTDTTGSALLFDTQFGSGISLQTYRGGQITSTNADQGVRETPIIASAIWDTAYNVNYVSVNGVRLQSTQQQNGVNFFAPSVIFGSRHSGASPDFPGDIDLLEVLVYHRYLAPQEANAVEAYLAKKWAVPGQYKIVDNLGSVATTSSYAVTASYALNGGGSGVSSSYATTASYATVAQSVLGSISSASFASTVAPGLTLNNPIVTQSIVVSGAVVPYRKNLGSVSGPQTLDFREATVFGLTMTGDVTFSYANQRTGSSYVIDVKQDGSGNRRIQFPTNTIFPLGIQTSGTLAANESDVYAIYFDGLSYFTTNFVVVPNASASYAISASYASVAQNVLGSITSASYALTASYALNGGGGPTVSASYAATASLADLALMATTASYATVAQNVLGSITSASYAATSSLSDLAITASYAINSAPSVSSSYAQTASLALNDFSLYYIFGDGLNALDVNMSVTVIAPFNGEFKSWYCRLNTTGAVSFGVSRSLGILGLPTSVGGTQPSFTALVGSQSLGPLNWSPLTFSMGDPITVRMHSIATASQATLMINCRRT